MNALSYGVCMGINDALAQATHDDSIDCVVLTGTERMFASGGNINEVNANTIDTAFSKDLLKHMQEVSLFPKPILAAISGFAIGGGLQVALQCDLIVVSPHAKISTPEMKRGVVPGAGGI
jgi:enoyl-CoA hydratase/carnithine racemase